MAEALFEPGSLQHRLPVLVDKTTAIKDEAIICADEIGIGNRALVVCRPGRDQLAPSLDNPNSEWRRGDIRDQFGTGIGSPPHRSVSAPDIFANLSRKQAKIKAEQEVAERYAAMLRPETSDILRDIVRPS